VNGEYAVRSENIRPLYDEAIELLQGLNLYEYRCSHIERWRNSRSDYLANTAIENGCDDVEWF